MPLSSITTAASRLDLAPHAVHPWGPGRAKIEPGAAPGGRAVGRLVLVSALSPTPAGEGKTVTTIGLAQGLARRGARVCAALREPSMAPVFGIKGGGAGGGRCRIDPAADVNLHFTGDLHAVGAAHNLAAAAADHALHFGGPPVLDPRGVVLPRVLDIGDRALRSVVTGLDGSGVPRQASFEVTAASEVMAALCLARDAADLRRRLDRLLVGFTADRAPVTAQDLGVTGAMMAMLRHALWPTLVQTLEGVPVLVHGGPFANIAHGANSVIATRLACEVADWVVTEAGFGFDLGAQKFLHLVTPHLHAAPEVVVIVATARALRWHGGAGLQATGEPAPDRVARGLDNLAHHVQAAQRVGVPVVVAINRFPTDAPDELAEIERRCAALGVPAVEATHFADGGAGAERLAEAVEGAAAGPAKLRLPGTDAEGFEARLSAISRVFHGSDGARLSPRAAAVLRRAEALGLGDLPPCIAKTQYSLSADRRARGAPTGFTLPIDDLKINAAAGFLVALAGDINRLPALPRSPAFRDIDLVDGEVTGA